jgi:probable rRNA maturation factor
MHNAQCMMHDDEIHASLISPISNLQSAHYICAVKKDSPIDFFKEDVKFRLNHSEELKQWILSAFRSNKKSPQHISYIFCSDKYLLAMNKKFLHHHYFTDIITFDNTTVAGKIEADIFISIDRIQANAKKFNTLFKDELHRVMIHGALHLIGYDDKKPALKKKMQVAEDAWLGKRSF